MASEAIGRPCWAHIRAPPKKGGRDSDGEAVSITSHPGTRTGYWIGIPPRMLQVYLNVSGVGAHTDRNKKTYTVKSVPLTVTPTALGHVDFTAGHGYYKLVCVWCHQGASFRSGHWISYVNTNEQWYEVDKEAVTPKRFEEIPFRFAYACGEQVWLHEITLCVVRAASEDQL